VFTTITLGLSAFRFRQTQTPLRREYDIRYRRLSSTARLSRRA
jgi:hypothetical protein